MSNFYYIIDELLAKPDNEYDKNQQKMIFAWIKKFSKALKGNLKEYWRYKVGNYRVLADIYDDQI